MNGACSGIFFFGRAPCGPGEGPKGQISLNFNYKVNMKDFFILNFVCVLTNERYKTYQTGFSFCRLGNVLGVGLGYLRVQNSIPSGGLSVMPKGLDQIQPNLVCELLTCLERATANKFVPRPLGPLGGVKRKYHLISITRSISNIFIPNFVCVFKNKDTRHTRRDFYSVAWVMPQEWDFWVLGVPRWSKIYFFQTWSCGISNRRE